MDSTPSSAEDDLASIYSQPPEGSDGEASDSEPAQATSIPAAQPPTSQRCDDLCPCAGTDIVVAAAPASSAAISSAKQLNNGASFAPLVDDAPSGSVSAIITTTAAQGRLTTETIATLTTETFSTTLYGEPTSVDAVGSSTSVGKHVLPLVLSLLLAIPALLALVGAWLWFRRRQRVWVSPKPAPRVSEAGADAGWRAVAEY
ncbi:hypothetical protein EVG20_g2372 [Dentipellis fragilis]|uniref:Uncharacterized protein n=1 Tax=Dentipellis fragilis TaxID=205917 RepID=A0A4Y9Z9Y2_9AGAM|nr:hypothetical protein EVG20_g2372 [Dentipellis fragilis]